MLMYFGHLGVIWSVKRDRQYSVGTDVEWYHRRGALWHKCDRLMHCVDKDMGAMHVHVYNRKHVCEHPNECQRDGNKEKAIKEAVLQSKKLNFQTII